MKLHLDLLLVLVAGSYLTLGIFARTQAEHWWWAYTVTVFVLAVADLSTGWKRDEND